MKKSEAIGVPLATLALLVLLVLATKGGFWGMMAACGVWASAACIGVLFGFIIPQQFKLPWEKVFSIGSYMLGGAAALWMVYLPSTSIFDAMTAGFLVMAHIHPFAAYFHVCQDEQTIYFPQEESGN